MTTDSTLENEGSGDDGDKPEFELFFADTHRATMKRVAYLMGDPSAAEEIVDAAYLRAFERWDTIADPHAWVATVVFREIAAHGRLRRRRMERLQLLVRSSEGLHDPVAAAEERDSAMRVMAEIAAMPYQQKLVAVAYWLWELPVAEIADALGCAQSTVYTHKDRAKNRLQRKFGQKGEWLGAAAWDLEGGVA